MGAHVLRKFALLVYRLRGNFLVEEHTPDFIKEGLRAGFV